MSFAAVKAVVGLAEQLDRAEPVLRPCSPAEGHLQILSFEVDTELGAELRGAGKSSFNEDPELVSADACELVFRGVSRRSAFREVAQLLVSGGVPVRVVQQLQVVHVAEHEEEGLVCVTTPGERFVEDARVQETGEKVSFGQLAQLVEVASVLICEPTDEETAGRVGHEPDRGRKGEDVSSR